MKKFTDGLLVIFAWIWALFTFFPFIITFFSSLKENNEIFTDMMALPTEWKIQNYLDAIFSADIVRAIGNSLFLGFATTFAVVICALPASYAFARMTNKFLSPLFYLFMLGVLIPIHTTIIPITKIAAGLGGYDKLWMLVLVYAAFQLPQAVFLVTGYIRGISKEIDDSARIDGCNLFQFLFRIITPISKPILATASILSFVFAYSELVFSVVLLSSPEKYPISRSLMYFKGDFSVRMGPIFASIILAVLPLVIIYLLFHEKVQSGVMSGSVKG